VCSCDANKWLPHSRLILVVTNSACGTQVPGDVFAIADYAPDAGARRRAIGL
jgi:hypothetical protein